MGTKKISQITNEEASALSDGDVFEGEEAGGTSFKTAFSVFKSTLKTYFDALYAVPGGGRYPAHVRCSIASGEPNPSEASAQTAVYAFPWQGNSYPHWNGSNFVAQDFTVQTLTLNAAHTSGSIYDIYLWLDGATQRVVTGPAWASATARGIGAGTAETEVVSGVMVNKFEMTVRNGANTYTMPAGYGTLVGTMVMSANGQVNWTSLDRGVWNKYNRLPISLYTCPGYSDNNSSTSFAISADAAWTEPAVTPVPRVKWVLGEPQGVEITANIHAQGGAASYIIGGVGIDSVTQSEGNSNNPTAGGIYDFVVRASNKGQALGIGSHYAAMLFQKSGAANGTVYADSGRRAGEAADSPCTYMNGIVMM